MLHRFNKNQRGLTLLELLIAIAITGIITGGITMTIFQVFDVNTRSSNRMIAVRQVQNAGYWLSHDAQMVQEEPDIVKVDGQLESISLNWTWETQDHRVVYTLLEDKLQREHYTNSSPDPDTTTIVAQYIDSENTSCNFTDTNGDEIGDKLIFTVTATVGKASETRIYEILPRPTPTK